MSTGYTIKLDELLKRPIIRSDYVDEWMNKMTDDELHQFDLESRQICLEEGVLDQYPDINAAMLSKHIDRCIMYSLFKSSKWNLNKF